MTHLHIYVKDEALEGLRIQAEQLGTGYQTLINGILKKHLESGEDISNLPIESQPLNKERFMFGDRSQNGKGLAGKD